MLLDSVGKNQKAWRSLFSLIIIIECFLHAFIKIRQRGKHLKETFHQLSQKVWEVYHTIDANAFRSQAAELLTWAESHTTGYVLEAVRKLCSKADRFVLAYDILWPIESAICLTAHEFDEPLVV